MDVSGELLGVCMAIFNIYAMSAVVHSKKPIYEVLGR